MGGGKRDWLNIKWLVKNIHFQTHLSHLKASKSLELMQKTIDTLR